MPLVWDQATYQAMYDVGDPTDATRRIHYTRELYELNRGWIAGRLAQLPAGWSNQDVVVVGCGFGWLVEQLLDNGTSVAVGVDPSPYVQANKAAHSRSDVSIVDATVGVDKAGSALRSAGFPRNYGFVVDDDAASSHSDAELAAFLDGCEGLLRGGDTSRIVHLVTPVSATADLGSGINWKSLADWAAVRPTHTWVDVRTGEVA